MRGRLAGLLLVLALGGSVGAAAAPAPELTSGPAAAVKACTSGYRHAIIGGRHTCLKAGQRCKRPLDRGYHRYGFHCHTGRLTRRVAPSPPPALPPPPAPPPLADAVKIMLIGAPSQFAVGGGSVWVGAHRGGLLFRIDPQTNSVRARIALPFSACGIAATAAAVWVGHCTFEERGLSRIDPETNQRVETIAGVRALDVTAGAGSIWITGAALGEVWRLEPQTSQFVAKIPVGERPHSSGFGFGSVWVASGGTTTSATVARIDPDTNQVVATIRVGTPRGDTALAVGEGAVWVANSSDDKLYRIDPATNTATAIDVGARDRGLWLGMSVAVGLGSVWIRTERDVVSRLDPSTNQVVQRMTLGYGNGGAGIAYGGGGLAVGFDSLWATDPEADLLLRIRL